MEEIHDTIGTDKTLKYIFPGDASQFSASECNQSDEKTVEKELDDVVLIF